MPAGDGRLVGAGVVRDDAIERREALGLALSLLLVLAAFVGWALWTGGAHARRLGTLARVARRMADGDFSARAQLRGRDEVALLGADVDRMAERLGALERARGEFVAKVSHDLRTPLTIIKGFAYTLERRAADPEDAQRLAAIGRESDRLAALVDDLLTLSQAGAGVLRMQHVRFRVADLLAEVAERVDVARRRARGRGRDARPGRRVAGRRPPAPGPGPDEPRDQRDAPHAARRADRAARPTWRPTARRSSAWSTTASASTRPRCPACCGPSSARDRRPGPASGWRSRASSSRRTAAASTCRAGRRGGTHARARIPALRPALVES